MSHDSTDTRPDFLVRLGLMPPVTEIDVKQAYLAKARTLHPDHGGDAHQFALLHEAFQRATEFAKFQASRRGWLGAAIERYVEHQALVEEAQQRGAKIQIDSIDWLRGEIGDDFAQVMDRIVGLDFTGTAADDETLAWLSCHSEVLAALRRLNLSYTKITDGGLHHLATLKTLTELDLTGTPVGKHVARLAEELPRLQRLGLDGTRVGAMGRFLLRWRYRGLYLGGPR